MAICVVGSSYGDEGKGKITDMICQDADVCVRFQGGANAGHSVVNDRGEFSLHILPSGVFNPNTVNIIGNGVALNVNSLKKEIEELKNKGVNDFKLLISDKVQLVMSYHILFDKLEEKRLGKEGFGSTKNGIAYFYSDKAAKIGFTAFELNDKEEYLREKIKRIIPLKNAILTGLYHEEPITEDAIYDELMAYKSYIMPYLADTMTYIRSAEKERKTVVLEGQLGSLRDIEFGIYPMVTSSSTIASYAPVGCGILPTDIKKVIAVCKAYSSSVGTGYMVPKMEKQEENILREKGGNNGEYGVTTGRPRDVAWFDTVSCKYGCMVQGATEAALTCVDCLGYLDEIKVCTAYEIDGEVLTEFPTVDKLKKAKPIYETLPGWKCDIRGIERYIDLPIECREYIEFLEEKIGVFISMVGIGPSRNDILYR